MIQTTTPASSHSSQGRSWTDQEISSFKSVNDLAFRLRSEGCSRCDLCTQAEVHGPVIFRGDLKSKYMLIGEGPGEDEDRIGEPFVGKAGVLLDSIFTSAGLKTSDWYIGNVTKGRSVAPEGSGRRNLTPTKAQSSACRPFVQQEVRLIQPDVLILAGKTAAESWLGETVKMAEETGKWRRGRIPHPSLEECTNLVSTMIIYHPAALLHASAYPEKYTELRQAMWQHIRMIRNRVDELEGRDPYYSAAGLT